MRHRSWLTMGSLLAVLGAACAKGTETMSPSPSPLVTSSPTETTSPSPSPSPSPALADGRYFGSIKSVDFAGQPPNLVFDLAYLLTGEAANKAAAQHGLETPVPNDYYIVNDNPRLRTLKLSPTVSILLLDWANCCQTRFQADRAKFEHAFTLKKYPSGNYKGKFSGYWLTIRDGLVVKIWEQFFP
jgi:hypothetical protein